MVSYRTPLGQARGLGSAKHGAGHWVVSHRVNVSISVSGASVISVLKAIAIWPVQSWLCTRSIMPVLNICRLHSFVITL